MNRLIIIFVISFHMMVTQTEVIEPEWPECDEHRVTWHPHPYACTK